MNIGQAAKLSGLSAKMIRYYETIGLLPNTRRSENGYRHFSGDDLNVMRFIQRARELGFSLDNIAQLLLLRQNPERSSAEVKALALEHIEQLNQRIAQLNQLRDNLNQIVQHCRGDQSPECGILTSLESTL